MVTTTTVISVLWWRCARGEWDVLRRWWHTTHTRLLFDPSRKWSASLSIQYTEKVEKTHDYRSCVCSPDTYKRKRSPWIAHVLKEYSLKWSGTRSCALHMYMRAPNQANVGPCFLLYPAALSHTRRNQPLLLTAHHNLLCNHTPFCFGWGWCRIFYDSS